VDVTGDNFPVLESSDLSKVARSNCLEHVRVETPLATSRWDGARETYVESCCGF